MNTTEKAYYVFVSHILSVSFNAGDISMHSNSCNFNASLRLNEFLFILSVKKQDKSCLVILARFDSLVDTSFTSSFYRYRIQIGGH